MRKYLYFLPLIFIAVFFSGLLAQEKSAQTNNKSRITKNEKIRLINANSKQMPNHVPGQFIVGYKKGISARQIKSLHSEAGTRSCSFNRKLNAELVEIGKSKLSLKATMRRFASHSNLVEYVEPNYIRQPFAADDIPNDTEWLNQWGMHNAGDSHIDILKAWDITTGSKDVIVAVVDTGVDYNHEDLKKNIWVNQAEKNGSPNVDDDGNGYVDDIHGYDFGDEDSDPMDVFGHGTHVSGIIGAESNNGKGIAGVCKDVSIMAVKIDSEWGFADWAIVEAIDYVTNMKAPIINASWGSSEFGITLKKAIDNYPGVFVVAAGNSLEEVHQVPQFPASYDLENILCVGASDRDGNQASFSSFGYSGVDIFAPGKDILSSLPGESEYQLMSGTSMASPFVAGVAALILAKYPGLTTEEVIQHILLGSKDKGFKCASRGLLNAYGALTKLPSLGTKKLTVEIEAPEWIKRELRWRWHGSRKLYKSGEAVTVPNAKLYIAHQNALAEDFIADPEYGTSVSAGSTSTKVRYHYCLPIKQSNGHYRVKLTREKPELDISKSARVFQRYTGEQAGLVKLKTKKVSIGFPFEFYGKSYNKVILTETGHLVFSKRQEKTGNTIFPRVVPNDETIIAPIWAPVAYPCYSDFSPNIYYKKRGKAGKKQFIVQYEFKETVSHFSYPWVSTCKVQVVLNQEDNSFQIFYNHLAPLNHTFKTRGVYGAVWDSDKAAPVYFNPVYSRVLGGDLCLSFNPDGNKNKLASVPEVVCESSILENRSGELYLKAVFSHPGGAKKINKANLYLYSYRLNPTTGLVISYDQKSRTIGLNDFQRNSVRNLAAGSGKKLENWFGSFVPSQFKVSTKGKYLTLEGPVSLKKGHTGQMKLYAGCEDIQGNYTGIRDTGSSYFVDRNYGWQNGAKIDEVKFTSKKKGTGILVITLSDADGATDIKDIIISLTHSKEEEVDWYGIPMKPATQLYYLPDYDFLRIWDDRYYYENIVEGREINWDDAAVLNNSSLIDIPKLTINSSDVEVNSKGKKLVIKIPFTFTKEMRRGVYDLKVEAYDYYALEIDYDSRAVKETRIKIK